MIEQKIEQKTISKTCGCEKSQFRCWFSCCLYRSSPGPGLALQAEGPAQPFSSCNILTTSLDVLQLYSSTCLMLVQWPQLHSTNTLQISYTSDLITNSCCQIDQRMFYGNVFFYFLYFSQFQSQRGKYCVVIDAVARVECRSLIEIILSVRLMLGPGSQV